ncbi:hypothetical protein [Kaistia granuli]|jgi:hypothetical protein|uniref:hypothetical protein n=1 Tax=Kaistia granuli TaxID=363259 RepID=UPI0003626B70|nr:hypothetical protein [Kaistia granuli]
MRKAVLALIGLVAGCTTTQPVMTAGSGLEQARRACQAAYDSGRITTREGRANCLSQAENKYPDDFADKRLLEQQQALRLNLAKKVDSRQLTQAQADAQYASAMRRLAAKSGG